MLKLAHSAQSGLQNKILLCCVFSEFLAKCIRHAAWTQTVHVQYVPLWGCLLPANVKECDLINTAGRLFLCMFPVSANINMI